MDNNEKSAKKGKFLIVDGNGLAYRSFYAVPVYKSSFGLPINALCGFVKLLFNVIYTEAPTHVAVAFDHSALTERLLKYQDYNVQREEMPDELALQLPIIEDFVHACGIRTYRMPGFEADDCIGTLVERAYAAGLRSLIISGDLELLQLVRPNVSVLTMRRGLGDTMVYNEENVKAMFRLAPGQLADLRALAGDSGQNISGIPGIGNVTASRLLSQYNSLEELYDNLDSLPAKWRTPLRENYQEALDYLRRATIRTDLPLKFAIEDCRFLGIPIALFSRVFSLLGTEEFAFGPILLERLQNMAIPEEPSLLPQSALVGDAARQALQLCRDGQGSLAVAWLINREKESGVAVSAEGQPIFYVSCEGEDALSCQEIWDMLTPAFLDAARRKYVFRSVDMSRRHRLVGENVLDIALAAGLLCPELWRYSLEKVCSRFGQVTYPSLLLFGDNRVDWQEIPLQNKVSWAGRAANMLAVLGPILEQTLRDNGLWELFNSVDVPFASAVSKPLASTECVDKQAVEEVSAILTSEMAVLQDSICQAAGYSFKIDDDRELGELLFGKLGLLVPTRPKAGEAIGAEIIAALEGQHPLVAEIRKYRELSELNKAVSQTLFAEGGLDCIINGSLYNLALMAERRLLSLNKVAAGGATLILHRVEAVMENVTNGAVLRQPMCRVLQSLIFPESEHCLAVLSMPQLALRVLAFLANDGVLAEAIEKGQVLRDLGEVILQVPAADLTASHMHTMSVMLYSYMGPQWLSRRLGVSAEKAESFLNSFDAEFARRFPKSWEYMQNELAKAKRFEILRTAAGRCWQPVEASSRMAAVCTMAERQAMTYAIEGTVTDIQRLICSRVGNDLGREVRILPVFDGFILSLPSEKYDSDMERVCSICQSSSYGIDAAFCQKKVANLAEAISELAVSV
ncbi:MAG: DNA polymerase [bacterium]|nr:DNA polymerase [bacterium]